MSPPLVLHLLSQRPGRTGSGVTLDAVVRHAAGAGWDQHVVVGTPAEDSQPAVGGLDPARVHPLVFGRGDLDFPVPGMSDVMPYPSSRWAALSPGQIELYCAVWRDHLQRLLAVVRPDVIHTHHLWLLSSLVKDLAPEIPVVTHCHGTGFRQMALCPHLAEGVREGCRRNERFLLLHEDHGRRLRRALDLPASRTRVVGAGFRDDIFHLRDRAPAPRSLLYAGKFSRSKGLPWLLDAVEHLARDVPWLVLHVAGDGAGPEADELSARMRALGPLVRVHGPLGQGDLADLMRQSEVFVLPSFYEGLPLVLVEAVACGCRVVCTGLPGVVEELLPRLGDFIQVLPLPRLEGVDRPVAEDLPAFVKALAESIEHALGRRPPAEPSNGALDALEGFTWKAVFGRIEEVWRELISARGDGLPRTKDRSGPNTPSP